MDFSFSEEQEMLRKAAREFLERECPASLVREMAADEKGYPAELWKSMAALGWLGLAFPTEYSGGGGSFLDLAVLVEEMGRVALPGPFFATVVLSGLHLLDAGTEEQKKRSLPRVASGEVVLTLALVEPGGEDFDPGSVNTRAVRQKDSHRINGSKLFVPYADSADYLLCVARTGEDGGGEGVSTFVVDARAPGVTITALKTMAAEHYCKVVLDGAHTGEMVGEPGKTWPGLEKTLYRATVALCADMTGGAQKVLDMTVEYSRRRIQFGRPIGSMQALQHHCSDMAVSIEAARALTLEAAWRVSRGLPFAAEASMAKSFTSECYTRCTQLGMMIQGGVSFMEDHDLPIYYRRAKSLEVALGDPDSHREAVAHILLD
jgi:alkylation response protein AidB-like acyl-CoA dehydrogenase